MFSSEDEEEVEEKSEGVLDMTVKSDGALKVAILDEQEFVLSTEVDKIDASGAISLMMRCFYLNTTLNRFEPWLEPTSILADLQMSEE